MIRITRQADYGIVLLTRFASFPEHRFSTPEVAKETGLPVPTVSKILKCLAREGLLVSTRGVKGGYELARDPQQITVADIIAALDGPIAITECIVDTPGECDRETRCRVRENWQRINDAVRSSLEEIKLTEMVESLTTPLVGLGSGDSAQAADVS